MRRTAFAAWMLAAAVGCAGDVTDDRWLNEGVGEASAELRKGMGGVNGDTDYCNPPALTCDAGESDCDSDSECTGALRCGVDNGPYFGFPVLHDVCVVAHCADGIRNFDETHTDCGGADCGTGCEATLCSTRPPSPSTTSCNADCPCSGGEGDCNAHADCTGALVCGVDNGPQFGAPALYDMCVPSHCTDRVRNFDETSTDCGGADCGPNCGAICMGLPSSPASAHCTVECPCPPREGDCDNNDAECQGSAQCVVNIGASFGVSPHADICLADHCDDGIMNGDETAIDCGPTCVPCAGSALYTQRRGGANQDFLQSVAIDSLGNIIVAGRFLGTTNLGGADLTRAGASPTASDIFVAKYSASGAHLWSRRFGAEFADGDNDVAIAVGRSGRIAMTGNFYLTVDFGTGPLTSAGSADGFVLVLDGNGSTQWARRFGSTGIDVGRDVTFDPGENVIVTGSFEGTVDLGGAPLTSAGASDIFVARYAGVTGVHGMSTRFGSTTGDRGEGVDTDASYRVYLSGTFGGATAFGSTTLTALGTLDAFAARLSMAGAAQWAVQYGGPSDDVATSITVDAANRSTITGYFKQVTNFGGTMVTPAGGDNTEVFVVGLDTSGLYRWHSTFGGSGNDRGTSIQALQSTGRVVVGGFVDGAVTNFPGGSSPGFGGTDAFLIYYGPDGALANSDRHGGPGLDVSTGVDVSPVGVAFGGYFEGAATVNGTALTSVGLRDVFISRVGL